VEIGYHINDRLLEQEQLSQDCFVSLQEMRMLGQSTQTEDGQRASALRFGDLRTMAILEALACQMYIPTEIGNRTLRTIVAQCLQVQPEAYSSAQMTYALRRLRLKGLIERIPHTHRYGLTELGLKVVTFFTKLHHRLFCPGLAALSQSQTYPSDLALALNRVADVLQSWSESAFSAPVADQT